MLQHALLGNVRELQNTLRRAAVWSADRTIGLEYIRDAMLPKAQPTGDDILGKPLEDGVNLWNLMDKLAQHYLKRALPVPREVATYWTSGPRTGNVLIKDMMETNCWDVPADPLDQIRLLGLLTGSYRNFDARAKAISKDTYVLIDAIHNFRNRAQHPDGQAIHLGVSVAAIMTCLELLACLERELSV